MNTVPQQGPLPEGEPYNHLKVVKDTGEEAQQEPEPRPTSSFFPKDSERRPQEPGDEDQSALDPGWFNNYE